MGPNSHKFTTLLKIPEGNWTFSLSWNPIRCTAQKSCDTITHTILEASCLFTAAIRGVKAQKDSILNHSERDQPSELWRSLCSLDIAFIKLTRALSCLYTAEPLKFEATIYSPSFFVFSYHNVFLVQISVEMISIVLQSPLITESNLSYNVMKNNRPFIEFGQRIDFKGYLLC